jgi:hypothetical protein
MEQASDKPTLLTVKEIAAVLQVPPSWVYPRADALGAFRVGKYLRFSLQRVLERLEAGAVGLPIVNLPTQRPLPNPIKKGTSDDHGTNSEQI